MGPARIQVWEVGVVVKSGARRAAALMAGVVVLAGVLVGCADKPGVAAQVNSTTITTTQLAATVDDLKPVSADVAASSVLNVLTLEPIYAAVAKKHGLAVSDDDAKALLKQVYAGKAVPSSAGILTVARFQLLGQKISAASDVQAIADEIGVELKKATVSVNPRFGSFDAKAVTVNSIINAPTTPTWLVATATPTPTPTA